MNRENIPKVKRLIRGMVRNQPYCEWASITVADITQVVMREMSEINQRFQPDTAEVTMTLLAADYVAPIGWEVTRWPTTRLVRKGEGTPVPVIEGVDEPGLPDVIEVLAEKRTRTPNREAITNKLNVNFTDKVALALDNLFQNSHPTTKNAIVNRAITVYAALMEMAGDTGRLDLTLDNGQEVTVIL